MPRSRKQSQTYPHPLFLIEFSALLKFDVPKGLLAFGLKKKNSSFTICSEHL